MSPVRTGLAVASLTALLWQAGALAPRLPRAWSTLDLNWYFLAVYDAFYGALRAGAPMLWNPYQLCGMPWLGTLQGGFFYPPHLLYVLLPTPSALGLSTVLHLALAAGGTAAFARRAGLSVAGATLAAAVWAFAGVLRGMQTWPYFLEAGAWLPFGALAILDLTERPPRGTIMLALASGMSWLAGCPQATVFAGYVWAALLATRLLAARPPAATAARAIGGSAVGVLAGLLLAGVMLLPALELAREGVRRTSTLSLDLMYSSFGTTSPRQILAMWVATGSPALLLGAIGLALLAALSASRALVLWGLVVTVVTAVFALGPATPLFRVYLALPLLGWFRMPSRVLLVGQFALGILAGLWDPLESTCRHASLSIL